MLHQAKSGTVEVKSALPLLEPTDTIKFDCQKCGVCCMGEAIKLMPYDIFRIAKFLNLSTDEVLSEFCNISLGETSKLPTITVKTKYIEIDNKRVEICPFLICNENNTSFLCMIHDVKPIDCEAFPLNTIINVQAGSINIDYFLEPNKACKGLLESKETTLEQWEKQSNMNLIKSALEVSMHCLTSTNEILNYKKFFTSEQISNEVKDQYFNDFMTMALSSLDTTRDVVDVMKEQCKKLQDFARKTVNDLNK